MLYGRQGVYLCRPYIFVRCGPERVSTGRAGSARGYLLAALGRVQGLGGVQMIRFTVYRHSTVENVAVWSGTPVDESAPIAFVGDMLEFGLVMDVGDVLWLSDWFYAVKEEG